MARTPAVTVALLLALAGSLLTSVACGPPPKNVLLVTVDTLRADRVGRVVAGRSLTPNLDRLQAEGASFDQVIVPVPRTSQSVASLLTGLHPVHHGVRGLFWKLPPDCGPTLAERLGAEGYRTVALASNLVLRPGQGFERGFSLYENPRERWKGNGAGETVSRALVWLEQNAGASRDGAAPWFLWLHLLDPHWPYAPAPPFDALAGAAVPADHGISGRYASTEPGSAPEGAGGGAGDARRDIVFTGAPPETVAQLTALYDGEVAATDAAIGRLLDGLERLGLSADTLLVVTADHGESLGEHAYWFAHGEYLYEEGLRVPALVRAPGLVVPGRRVERLVRSYDLMPTILELLGLDPPAGLDGVSRAPELLAAGAAAGADPGDGIYLESDRELLRPGNPKRFLPGYAGSMRAWRDDRFKLIRVPHPGGDRIEAFDLREDPHEEHPLDAAGFAAAAGARAEAATRALAAWEELAAGPARGAVVPPEPAP